MTIKTTINGEPFELTVPSGTNVEFSAGKIRVFYDASLYNGMSEAWKQQLATGYQNQKQFLNYETETNCK